jgi:hypothetical protein
VERPDKIIEFPSVEERSKRDGEQMFGDLFRPMDEHELSEKLEGIDLEAAKTRLHGLIMERMRGKEGADAVLIGFAEMLPKEFLRATDDQKDVFMHRTEEIIGEIVSGSFGQDWEASLTDDGLVFRRRTDS